jgi:hypothetical protein
VIAARYARGSLIVTRNLPFGQRDATFAQEAMLTAARLDRLLHDAPSVAIAGRSCRLKHQRQAGRVRATKGAVTAAVRVRAGPPLRSGPRPFLPDGTRAALQRWRGIRIQSVASETVCRFSIGVDLPIQGLDAHPRCQGADVPAAGLEALVCSKSRHMRALRPRAENVAAQLARPEMNLYGRALQFISYTIFGTLTLAHVFSP